MILDDDKDNDEERVSLHPHFPVPARYYLLHRPDTFLVA